jgi:hypothetical protein
MSSNDNNWWTSSVQDDFTPVISRNPYPPTSGRTQGGRYGGRTFNGGQGGRGDWTPPSNIQQIEVNQEPTYFSDEASTIVANIVNSDPTMMLSELDFGDITCPRENFMAVL